MSNEIPTIRVSSPDKNEDGTGLKQLLENIQSEINSFKTEHRCIRDELTSVVEENKHLAAQKHQQSTAHVVDETLERLQSEAVTALKNQLYFITQEKQTLEKLWRSSQATVVGLEHEIREYRATNKAKHEYVDTIKAQQLVLQDLKKRLSDQTASSEVVKATKIKLEEQLQSVTMQFEDCDAKARTTETNLAKTRAQLEETAKLKSRLEEALRNARQIAGEHVQRETEALDKVQEAISVAETAFQREQAVREECDYLATTIGTIMEEAAQKVEQDRKALLEKHGAQVEKLTKQVKQLKAVLKVQLEKVAETSNRNRVLDAKVRELTELKSTMESDLQQASRTMIELECNCKALQRTIALQEDSQRLYEEKTQELVNFVDSHNKLKERWKTTVLEITEKLETKIKALQSENVALRKENVELLRLLSESSS